MNKTVPRFYVTRCLTQILLSAVVFFALYSFVCAQQNIYKYVDDEGVIHLTNVPSRPGVQYTLIWRERVHIDPRIDTVKYGTVIYEAAKKYNIDANLIRAMIRAESNYNPRAVSRAGAKGLMQLMPHTAAHLNVPDAFHPENNIEGGVRYLRYLMELFRGDWNLALAAYNAGEGTVMRYGNRIPPYRETQTYVKRVMTFYHQYSGQTAKLARSY